MPAKVRYHPKVVIAELPFSPVPDQRLRPRRRPARTRTHCTPPLPNQLNAISGDPLVTAQDRRALDLALGGQDAVERIAMVIGEAVDVERMGELDRQHAEAVERDLVGDEPCEVAGHPEPAEPRLDRQLPAGRGADIDLVAAVAGGLPGCASRACTRGVFQA